MPPVERQQNCEIHETGLEYGVETCVTWRGRPGRIRLNESKAIAEFVYSAQNIAAWDREKFMALVVDAQYQPLALIVLFEGTPQATMADVAFTMRRVLTIPGGVAVAFMHNHPSGEVKPSEADEEVAQLLSIAGGVLALKVYDHLILGRDGVWSTIRDDHQRRGDPEAEAEYERLLARMAAAKQQADAELHKTLTSIELDGLPAQRKRRGKGLRGIVISTPKMDGPYHKQAGGKVDLSKLQPVSWKQAARRTFGALVAPRSRAR